jgi:hypothetical protein
MPLGLQQGGEEINEGGGGESGVGDWQLLRRRKGVRLSCIKMEIKSNKKEKRSTRFRL